MTKPSFSMTFNLGHLLHIASLIVAMTVGYVTMDARTSTNQKDIRDLVADMEQTISRVRVVENNNARADERMNSILALLARIDGRLERIEQSRQ